MIFNNFSGVAAGHSFCNERLRILIFTNISYYLLWNICLAQNSKSIPIIFDEKFNLSQVALKLPDAKNESHAVKLFRNV